MKLGIRFYISWILSAMGMFILFYLWHGVFLNDFKRLTFPLSWFVTFAAFTYLILGAGMFLLFEAQIMKRIYNFFFRALLCGLIAGISLFMIVTVLNFSLTTTLSVQHLMVDCIWQICEQTGGALFIFACKVLIPDPKVQNL